MTKKEEKGKQYLEDVQVGDILYNFLRGNKMYRVTAIHEPYKWYPILVEPFGKECFGVHVTLNGTESPWESVPYYLYDEVDVLDPRNLPSRPSYPKFTPKRGLGMGIR